MTCQRCEGLLAYVDQLRAQVAELRAQVETREVSVSEVTENTRLLARALEASITRNTPAEPSWWSQAIEIAAVSGTTPEYQVWLAVRHLLETT